MNKVMPIQTHSTNLQNDELASSNNDSSLSNHDFEGFETFENFLRCFYDALASDNHNTQSTKLYVERFDIHNLSNLSNSSSVPNKKTSNLFLEKEQLLTKIRYSNFEFGLWTDADAYFEELIRKHDSLETPLSLLSDIVNKHLSNDHILEGILHILSNFSYEELKPFGITIAIACTVNHSPIIQDLLLTCFENWNSKDAIQILSELDLQSPWLSKYRDTILEQLITDGQAI